MKNKDEEYNEGLDLCLSCGMCCMGYFHVGAILNDEYDLKLANQMGVDILKNKENEQFISLPCIKFDGKCSIYPERPSVCGNHQCDLLKNLKEKKINLGKAKDICIQMKNLCSELHTELDIINSNDQSRTIVERFKPFFRLEKSYLRKQNPDLFLKYASFIVLKNRYFYKEKDKFFQSRNQKI